MELKITPKFKAYLKDGTVAPYVKETYTGSPWVLFGKDNAFPDAMRVLADNCVPLGRSVEQAAMFIAGKGIKFVDKDGNEVEAAQVKFQEWLKDTTEEDFIYSTALDIALLNAKSWTVRRAAGGAVARLDHIDVSRVRSGKKVGGKVGEFYWSADWAQVGSRGGASEMYRPVPIPAYEAGSTKAATELIYTRTYKQGRDYYAEPWYLAAVPDCEVWAKVPVFNKTQIDTGFRPTIHLHLPYIGDPKDIDQVIEDIQDSFTGASGNGLFPTFGNPNETAPTLTPIERGDRAGELDTIRDNAEKVIVRAYGIPDILYRMDTSGGLTSQGSALKAALEQFQKTFVEPKQAMITKDLVRLMNESGIAVWDAEIEELEVFEEEGQSDQIKLRVMKINELREEMDLPELDVDDERGDVIPGMFGNPMTDELEMVTPTTGQASPTPAMPKKAAPVPPAEDVQPEDEEAP